jgi:predicted acylesterase/phospholipase RssA
VADGKDPELRLGLVLYGGVALAVYIYGVVIEVQRLLLASAAHEKAGADGEGDALEGYAEALRKGGLSRASVDIVAGTSAGGINGILLAKALASGGDVEAVRDLWIKGGDIGGLLHRLDDGDSGSLLSTDVMEAQLAEGFGKLDGGGTAVDGALDLFVSATHLRGDLRRFRDSLDADIDSLKHRYVFQLKLRPRYKRNDFAAHGGDPNGHLVKLSRATSAFPVAFEPVEITRADGILDPRDEPSGWFADGGILNNKPFTEALRTIFSRSSDRPVRRWLLSVDPDPKPVTRPAAPGPKPAFDQIAVSAVAQIPRYQSIAADLEALEEHNAAAQRVNAMVADLEWDLQGEARGEGAPSAAYQRLRLWALADAIAERLMTAVRPTGPGAFQPDVIRRGFAEAAYGVLSRRESWEDKGLAELPDLAFELRRAYYLIKLIAMAVEVVEEGAGGPPGPDQPDSPKGQLWDAFELVTQALWANLAEEEIAIEAEPGSAAPNQRAFERGEERVSAALVSFDVTRGDASEAMAEAVAGVSVRLRRPAPAEGEPLTFLVDLERVFAEFHKRDDFMLPIEAGGGLRHRDLVEHAQISPATTKSTGIEPAKKLAGDTAGHFGGFLDQGWRENDLLWGRLDAAEILVGAILADSSEESDGVLEAIHREILESEGHGAPAGDVYAYLRENQIGDATMADLPAERMAGLKARAAFVLRGMIRGAARQVESDPTVPPKNARRRALIAIDGALRTAGKAAFPYVRWLRRRARDSEPKP